MRLTVLSGLYAICQVAQTEDLTEKSHHFLFLTCTDDECSLVCSEQDVPRHAQRVEKGWSVLRVEGSLDFSLVGVIAGLSSALAAANVPIFVVSTFNTDYVLVKTDDLARAVEALRRAGYEVDSHLKNN